MQLSIINLGESVKPMFHLKENVSTANKLLISSENLVINSITYRVTISTIADLYSLFYKKESKVFYASSKEEAILKFVSYLK